MNVRLIGTGFLFMVLGFVFTVITFGFGLFCIWPLIIVGILLFIMGFLIPSQKIPVSKNEKTDFQKDNIPHKLCDNCGKTIPFYSDTCPNCMKRFR